MAPANVKWDYHRPERERHCPFHSALRSTMRNAYNNIDEVWRSRKTPSLRSGAFCYAIEKVGVTYENLGNFP